MFGLSRGSAMHLLFSINKKIMWKSRSEYFWLKNDYFRHEKRKKKKKEKKKRNPNQNKAIQKNLKKISSYNENVA